MEWSEKERGKKNVSVFNGKEKLYTNIRNVLPPGRRHTKPPLTRTNERTNERREKLMVTDKPNLESRSIHLKTAVEFFFSRPSSTHFFTLFEILMNEANSFDAISVYLKIHPFIILFLHHNKLKSPRVVILKNVFRISLDHFHAHMQRDRIEYVQNRQT